MSEMSVRVVDHMGSDLTVVNAARVSFGKTVSEMLMSRLVSERVRDVVIALDPDALSTAVSISQRLMRYGIKVRNTNLENGDPSDLGYKTMLTKIDEAQPLSLIHISEPTRLRRSA